MDLQTYFTLGYVLLIVGCTVIAIVGIAWNHFKNRKHISNNTEQSESRKE